MLCVILCSLCFVCGSSLAVLVGLLTGFAARRLAVVVSCLCLVFDLNVGVVRVLEICLFGLVCWLLARFGCLLDG